MMKKLLKSLLPVTLMNEIVLFCFTLRLPDRIPTHLSVSMEVNQFGSRWIIIIIGVIPIAISVGFFIYWHVMKDNENSFKNRKTENILFPIMVIFLMAVTWMPVLLASVPDIGIGSKIELPMDFIIVFPLGVLMIITFNFMGVIKQNHWVGIRTPWTLKNGMVWKKTHRLGGYTGVIGGILMCMTSAVGFIYKKSVISMMGLVFGIILIAIVPIVYSYIIYKKESAKPI